MQHAHINHTYEEQLLNLRTNFLMMVGKVENIIESATNVLLQRDAKLAKKTIYLDHAINQSEIDLDSECLELIALRQPVASDLRFIVQLLKMVVDLERIGDLSVNLCERCIDLENHPSFPIPIQALIEDISMQIQTMLKTAIDSFIEKDAAKAGFVVTQDSTIDELYDFLFREILSMMQKNPEKTECGVHLLSVAKVLERIADHCTNLAEQVIFMLQGRDIRHLGKL